MLATQQLVGNKQGPIASLPPELLRQVISYAEDGVRQLRLVCRGFYEHSWSTFGASLKNTTFDIRSIDSMKALVYISEDERLAQHVSALKFTTGIVDIHPFMGEPIAEPKDYMDDQLLAKVIEYENSKRYVFDVQGWNDRLSASRAFSEAHPANGFFQSDQNYIDHLAKTLSKFRLDTVTYLEDQEPADYAPLRRQIMQAAEAANMVTNSDMYLEQTEDLELQAYKKSAIQLIGLDMFLQSLAVGIISPKDLTIPVLAQCGLTFTAYTTLSIFQKVLAKVESLATTYTGHRLSMYKSRVRRNMITLNSSLAPKLQHMHWDWARYDNDYNSFHVDDAQENLPPFSPSPIRHLELSSAPRDSFSLPSLVEMPLLFSFFDSIGPTLTTLRITISGGLCSNYLCAVWEDLLQFLVASHIVNLDRLEIIVNGSGFVGLFPEECHLKLGEQLYEAATTVDIKVIKDEYYEGWLGIMGLGAEGTGKEGCTVM